MAGEATPRRERYRRETIEEAKERALAQIAAHGAGSLSLNAIAREMGMTGPALYRYVGSRDELLTELVVAAYDELGDALWRDLEATAGQSPEQRQRAQAWAYRNWALANPQRFLLIFGTPVPGYQAPIERTVPAAQRVMAASIALLADGDLPSRSATTDPYVRELEAWADAAGMPPLPGILLHQAIIGWTRLHGVLSLELEGHFKVGLPDPERVFAAEVDALIREYEAALESLRT